MARHVIFQLPILLTCLWGAPSVCAQASAADPVTDLRQVLGSPVSDLAGREAELKKCVSALASLGDLRKAVTLSEWRDQDLDAAVKAVDQAYRSIVSIRFEQAARTALQRGDAASRLAVLNMLAEMARTSRNSRSVAAVVSLFAPDLIKLIQAGEPQICEAAARTLGQVRPDLDPAVTALGRLLASQATSQRVAAADGLVSLVWIAGDQALQSNSSAVLEQTRRELARTGLAVAPLAGRGLQDVHPLVRRRSAQILGETASVLTRLLPNERSGNAAFHDARSQQRSAQIRAELQPLVAALKEQERALAEVVNDTDAEARLMASRALEDLANAAAQLEAAASSTSGRAKFQTTSYPGVNASPGLHEKLPELGKVLLGPDVRARRAALDLLEAMGPAAAPVAPVIVKSLGDQDRFVRWAAARTLSRIGAVEAETAVPGLARLLNDSDVDVRLAAAAALQVYGTAAKDAVPALVGMMKASDAELCIAAIRVVDNIGHDASAAIPTLITTLSDRDARVRQLSAQTLGKLGAHEAVNALRKALNDRDAGVRKAASDALLTIH